VNWDPDEGRAARAGQVWRDRSTHLAWFVCGIAVDDATGGMLLIRRQSAGRQWVAVPLTSLEERMPDRSRRWTRVR
jgi:hypothetical protein